MDEELTQDTVKSTENSYKIKLLKLWELLRQETDSRHPMITRDIIARLAEMGIGSERRTLAKDIETLLQYGYEIKSTNVSHSKGYYVDNAEFSTAELRILLDAVQSASFITKEKTAALIEKIASAGGSHRRSLLEKNIVCFNTRKHTNEEIYSSIDQLETAITGQKKASFVYFDLDENLKRKYRKRKERYTVDPLALVYIEDNYYLMTFSSKYDGYCNYRVDRMEDVRVEEEDVSPDAAEKAGHISAYTEEVFRMYGGPECEAVLQFDNSLIGVIYDKFGEDTKVIRQSSGTCIATVRIQVSPTFWGWFLQFPGRMKILSPDALIHDYREWLKKCE